MGRRKFIQSFSDSNHRLSGVPKRTGSGEAHQQRGSRPYKQPGNRGSAGKQLRR